jgi:hypothetical protein
MFATSRFAFLSNGSPPIRHTKQIRRSYIPPRGRGPRNGHSLLVVAFLQIEGRSVVSCETCMVGGLHGRRRSFHCSASPAVFRPAPCSHYRPTGLVRAFYGLARLHMHRIHYSCHGAEHAAGKTAASRSCCCAQGPRYGQGFGALFIERNDNQPVQRPVLDTLVAAVRPWILSSSWYGSVDYRRKTTIASMGGPYQIYNYWRRRRQSRSQLRE